MNLSTSDKFEDDRATVPRFYRQPLTSRSSPISVENKQASWMSIERNPRFGILFQEAWPKCHQEVMPNTLAQLTLQIYPSPTNCPPHFATWEILPEL